MSEGGGQMETKNAVEELEEIVDFLEEAVIEAPPPHRRVTPPPIPEDARRAADRRS
jgi:hypothetical protein